MESGAMVSNRVHLKLEMVLMGDALCSFAQNDDRSFA